MRVKKSYRALNHTSAPGWVDMGYVLPYLGILDDTGDGVI